MTRHAEVILSILGSSFRVTSEDARMVDLVRELWGPFVAGPERVNPADVRLEVRGEAWHLRMADEPHVAASDPWLVASSLRNALSRRAIARATSIVPLHAAAAERDGVFVVLSGQPRAGKTTLLLDLLDRGWRLVTDDLVPLDPKALTATPFPKPLSIRDPDRWARFARGWDVPGWLPPPAGAGLLPADALPLSAATTFTPSVLVFPQFDEGAAPLGERLTAAQTLAWTADNLHTREPGPGVLPALARLGTEVPGHVLRYGSSDAALGLLEKCLAGSTAME
ncbi:MAG TPA: hypothetical protein VEU29_03900 [Actinomycetota bacterium]|nr:hypothetical protein [Actinomycetota bacterium]